MVGLSDMTDNEIADLTGLELSSIPFVRARDFTEPFILKDEIKLEALKETAQKHDLKITKGGRFYHLMSKFQDKGVAVKQTIALFEDLYQESVHSIALGDSENDLSMLHSVDIPVLIPHPDGTFMKCNIAGIKKAPFPGSKGWNAVLKEYFNVK